MNLLLFETAELSDDNELLLTGDRAAHLLRVLRVRIGDDVKVGQLGGAQGLGTVVETTARAVRLRCVLTHPGPAPGTDTLLLAFPRPKVLARCLEHAAALGFGTIAIFRSARVEKSHLLSHVTEPTTVAAHVRAGLEQSRRTHPPTVSFLGRFGDLLERYPAGALHSTHFIADPEGSQEASLTAVSNEPLTVAIGPEGGFVPAEVEALKQRGFRVVRAGTQPLRVETALAYVTGQLHASRLRTAVTPP